MFAAQQRRQFAAGGSATGNGGRGCRRSGGPGTFVVCLPAINGKPAACVLQDSSRRLLSTVAEHSTCLAASWHSDGNCHCAMLLPTAANPGSRRRIQAVQSLVTWEFSGKVQPAWKNMRQCFKSEPGCEACLKLCHCINTDVAFHLCRAGCQHCISRCCPLVEPAAPATPLLLPAGHLLGLTMCCWRSPH